MKKHLATLLILPLLALAAFAQDDKKTAKAEKRAKQMEETTAFLQAHLPEMAKEIAALKAGGDKKAHRAALRTGKEFYMEYKFAKEEIGQGFADTYLEELKVTPAAEEAIENYLAAGADDKAAAAKALEGPMAALTKAQIATVKAELAVEKDEEYLKMLKEDLAELESTDDPAEIVKAFIADIEAAEVEEQKHKDILPKAWHYELDKAQAAAKASGKPIHVVFSTVWCGPCKAMAKSVYPQDKVKAAMEKYEPLYIDGDEYPQVVKKYKVRGYPTFLVLDAEGELQRTAKFGGTNAETFIKWLEK